MDAEGSGGERRGPLTSLQGGSSWLGQLLACRLLFWGRGLLIAQSCRTQCYSTPSQLAANPAFTACVRVCVWVCVVVWPDAAGQGQQEVCALTSCAPAPSPWNPELHTKAQLLREL